MSYCNLFTQMNFNLGAMIGNSLANLTAQRFFGGGAGFGFSMFGLYQYPSPFNSAPMFFDNSSLFVNQTPQYSDNYNSVYSFNLTEDNYTSGAFGISNTGFNSGFDTFIKSSPVTTSRPASKRNSSTRAYKLNQCSNNAVIEGYNKTNGEKLAKIAWDNHSSFEKHCAAYVSNALEQAGLSNGKRGDGYQMAGILRENTHFKEISVSSVDWKHLPAGCILCYDKGAQGYSSEYGHVEISTGNGTAVSDGLTQNIKKPSAIFVPV